MRLVRVIARCLVIFVFVFLPTTAAAQLVVASGPGSSAVVREISATDDRTLQAYDPAFLGGVNMTLGDVDGDGTVDIITGAGAGGSPHVRVFSGVDLHELRSFYAYDPAFAGGVRVAAGDIDGDGRADIITGAGPGGAAHVKVFSGVDLHLLASFLAYDHFGGGVFVASGDVNGDGRTDIVTGAGPGGGPHVEAFSGVDLHLLASFYAYDPAFHGGVSVAAADLDGDGRSDLITGAGPGGSPHVVVFSGLDLHQLASFYAFDPAFSGGVNVAAGDLDGDGRADLIAGAGPGGGPHVRVFSGVDLHELASFFAFDGGSGATVGSTGDDTGVRITSPAAASFLVGSPGSLTITTVGNPTPTLTSTGALPGGVTFVDNGNGTATLAGIPAAGTGGAYPLTFTASNGVQAPGQQSFTLTVQQPPAITSANAATFTVGTLRSFTVATTGFPLPTLTRGGVALPAGVTFVDNGDGTGLLSGTAAAGTAGTYALTFTAANGIGSNAVQTFTLTVNQAPAITSASTATFLLNTAGTTFQVVMTGSPAPTVSVTSGVLPTGLMLSAAGLLSGTPTQSGSFPVTLTATNGTLPNATQAFTVVVNAAPAITSANNTTFSIGVAGSFNVVMTGFPAPTVSVTAGTLPAGVTLSSAGLLSGTPDPGTSGVHNVTLTATNGISPNATQAFALTVNQAPAITSANSATFQLNTPGTTFQVVMTGNPAPTVSVTSGVLPTGVTLSAAGLLSGTPTQSGSFPVTLTATNGTLPNATQAFTVVVNAAPAITSANSTTFTIGVAGSFNVVMTGFPAPTVSVTAGTLPAGVTLSSAGLLSGTPDPGTSGVHNVTLTATNGIGANATQAFALTVNQAPAITSANSATFVLNTAGTSFQVVMSGVPAPTVSVTSGVLPTGLTLSSGGLLSGTPTQSGSFPVTLTATNGTLPNATQAFTVVVNAAPAITSANNTFFSIGVAGSFNVVMTGFPAPTVTVTAGTLPAGVTLSPSGLLSGTPDPGTGGVHNLTFTATNGISPDATQAFTLTVGQAPAITSANSATFVLNTAGTTFQVVMTGSPAPTVSVTSGVLPTGLTLSSAGLLSGTPTQSGSFPVTLTATNGTLPNATQAFTVVVNSPPAITSAAATTFTVGTAGSFTVVMTGFPAPTVSVTAGTLPAGVTLSPAGVLSGTPDPGTGGVRNLTLTATNGVGVNATQAFTLTINQAPAITSANTATFVLNTAGTTFQVVMTGFPAPTVSVTTGVLPTGLTLSTAGLLSGTPTQSGSFPVTLTATNSTLPNATQAFTVVVNAPPAITSANSATFTVGLPGTFTVATTGFPAPTVSQTGTPPTGVTFTPATKVLAGTATQTGAFPLVFTATNAVVPDAVQSFTLTVACPAITVSATTLPDGLYQILYGGATFTQTGSTGSTFTWSATGLPAGITINAVSGVVSGTPTNTVAGGPVGITVTDNFGCQGTRSASITVRPVATAESYANGVGNTQFVVGATAPATPFVLATENGNVKTGDNGPAPLFVTFPATTTNLGTITEGATDGTFTYTPPVGFAGPTDTFTYTLQDSNGVTNTATVTIALADLVWYVNNSGLNGDGRSHSPFNSLANAATPSISNSFIYVHTGGGAVTPTPGNLALDAIQTLQGAGGIFSLHGLTIAATGRPTLSGTVTLANSVAIKDLNFAGAAPAITASGLAMTAVSSIDQVNVTGGTSALSLTNVTATGIGAINVSNATFMNTSAAEVLISTGNVPITFASTVIISSNAGRSIDIQGRTGGTIAFNGPITDTSQGIFLDSNAGTTINFTGGLALTTGSFPAFTATAPLGGTGTVSATQNNTTILNTIATTTGTALNVANTTIGAGGLTFRSISANGGVNGILLNTTGAGAFSVVGVGTTLGSGGTIQSTTNRGASFISASNITLKNMNFTNTATVDLDADNSGLSTGDNLATNAAIHLQVVTGVILDRLVINGSAEQGINGNTVTNFALTNSTIQSTGNAADEDGLHFFNMLGTNTITSTSITSSGDDNVNIQNASGTSTITITGGSFNTGGLGSGLLFGPRGTTNTTINISGVTIDNNFSGGVVADASDTATMTIKVSAATITNNNDGIQISDANGNVGFDIDNVNINSNDFLAITILKAAFSTTGTLQGFIRNSQIAVANGRPTDALSLFDAGGGNMTVAVTNNTIDYAGTQRSMLVQGGQDGNGVMNITITGNTTDIKLDGVGDGQGILAQAAITGTPAPVNTTSLCADIGGAGATRNTFTHSLGGAAIPAGDIRVRQRFDGTVRLPGFAGAGNDTAAVVSYLNARNTVVSTSTATLDGTTPHNFTGGGACTQPVVP